MSRVLVTRNNLRVNNPKIQYSKNPFQILANLEEKKKKERKIKKEEIRKKEEERKKKEDESQPNFNVISEETNSRIFSCDTPEKKRLHPLCIRNSDPEKETKKRNREKKINNFFNEYKLKVGTPVPEKNQVTKEYNPRYGEYRNKYFSFVEEIRKDPNKEWMYEHFYLPYEIIRGNPQNKYIYSHQLSYTQRQRLRLRGHLSNIIRNIKTKYFEEKNSNSEIIQNINLLFTSIGIHDKIKFNFQLNKIIQKLNIIRNFMTSIDINYFLDTQITGEIINGKKVIYKIFEDYEREYPININYPTNYSTSIIYNFLLNNKILNDLFIETYNLQFTHRYRKAAKYGLIELISIYKTRIHFLYKLIKIKNLTINNITQLIINELILPCIEKYLFYTNYGLINNFEIKKLFLKHVLKIFIIII